MRPCYGRDAAPMRADTYYSAPGSALAVERARRGLTQRDVAREMAVSRQRVAALEGAARVPARSASRFMQALEAAGSAGAR